ncbi:acyl carrier protein [Rhodococcus sp. NPDC059234]|uniref:acyl carrier protein n=1 Tax=Rhodococcus sp. NPDC059234 TaxID=3346781 RepID=UPI00366BA7A0
MYNSQTTADTLAPITHWLTDRVADHLDLPAEDVDPTVELAVMGMDSVATVNLCGEIEDRWLMYVDATLVFDYPTIAQIAGFVADAIADRSATAS